MYSAKNAGLLLKQDEGVNKKNIHDLFIEDVQEIYYATKRGVHSIATTLFYYRLDCWSSGYVT